jgi:hypothetical protein
MSKVEDRRHARYELQEPGFLRILGPPGGAFVITILDVSKRGMRIRCSRPLPEGTRVEVRCRNTPIIGEVRYTHGIDPEDVYMGVLAKSVAGVSADIDLTLLFPDLIRF